MIVFMNEMKYHNKYGIVSVSVARATLCRVYFGFEVRAIDPRIRGAQPGAAFFKVAGGHHVTHVTRHILQHRAWRIGIVKWVRAGSPGNFGAVQGY